MSRPVVKGGTLRFYGEVRLLATDAVKVAGTLYGVIQRDSDNKYWNGTSWVAGSSLAAAPGAAHDDGGDWYVVLADAQVAADVNYTLRRITDQSDGSESTTVYSVATDVIAVTSENPLETSDIPTAAEIQTQLETSDTLVNAVHHFPG